MKKNLLLPTFLALLSIAFLAGCTCCGGGSSEPATAKAALCSNCGEIKGTDVCCHAEGRETCEKCGLYKGSAGCCKIPEGHSGDLILCTTCGEIKGTDACCNAEGRTVCSKCGLFEGAPACCKLDVK